MGVFSESIVSLLNTHCSYIALSYQHTIRHIFEK